MFRTHSPVWYLHAGCARPHQGPSDCCLLLLRTKQGPGTMVLGALGPPLHAREKQRLSSER